MSYRSHLLGTPARPRACTRTALSEEPEGKTAARAITTVARDAVAVGAKPQRSTEKARGRAGSPTRAT